LRSLAGGAPDELRQPESLALYAGNIPNEVAELGQGLPVRLLSRAKLSFLPDDGLEAKIYLYAGFM